jgi:hypothetical protein
VTQPKFAPILPNDEVRELDKLPPPQRWEPHRPGELPQAPEAARRRGRGAAGPDQGYALLLAERFREHLVLSAGEDEEDVMVGATTVAMRRAALFGRAPVIADLELVLRLLGYLDQAPTEVVLSARRKAVAGIAHDYWLQRQLADAVPDETLRLSPADLAERLRADPGSFDSLSGLKGGEPA